MNGKSLRSGYLLNRFIGALVLFLIPVMFWLQLDHYFSTGCAYLAFVGEFCGPRSSLVLMIELGVAAIAIVVMFVLFLKARKRK